MYLDTFGKRLKILRVDRGLSQIELRDKMETEHGVSIGETYISELERTTKMPTLEVAAAMAKVLDVSLDYLGLLMDDATVSYRRELSPVFFSEEADEVAQLIDKMKPDQRGTLVMLARNLSASTNERQRRRQEAKEVLDSIERNLGRNSREEVERIMRDKGLFVDGAS